MSKSGTAAGTGNNRALPGPCSIVDAHVQVGLRGDSFGMDAFSDYFMAQPAVQELFTKLAEDEVQHQAFLRTIAGNYDAKGVEAFKMNLRS